MKGPLVILSGPSGSGKSKVISGVLRGNGRIHLAVSATTRPPRRGEQDGNHYFFWDRDKFEGEIEAGSFLEWFEVVGNYYGTLRSQVDPFRENGLGVLLEIDVQGAAAIRQQYPEAVSVFLKTRTFDEYERRLRNRGTENEEQIRRRLAKGRQEEERVGEFDHVVINDDLETAVAEFKAIIARAFTKG